MSRRDAEFLPSSPVRAGDTRSPLFAATTGSRLVKPTFVGQSHDRPTVAGHSDAHPA